MKLIKIILNIHYLNNDEYKVKNEKNLIIKIKMDVSKFGTIIDPSWYISQLNWDRNQPRNNLSSFHVENPITKKLNPHIDNATIFRDQQQIKDWTYLEKIKRLYHDDKYRNRLRYLNPYEELKNSVFINRAAVKLANIDAVFDFTHHRGGIISPQGMTGDDPQSTTQKIYGFLDLAGAPGGFTDYIMYRMPLHGRGYGISLREGPDTNEALIWDPKILNLPKNQFSVLWGEDNTGNLFTNSRWLIDHLQQVPLSLIAADGAYSVEGLEEDQEKLSSRIILTEIAIGLELLEDMSTNPDGTFVCKIFDSFKPVTRDLLWILCQSFNSMSIFKPISSRPGNSERYIVCQGLRKNIAHYYSQQLLNFNDNYHDDYCLFDDVDQSFLDYLYLTNQENIDRQIYYGEKVIRSFIDDEKIDQVNIIRVQNIWNIPPSPDIMKRHLPSDKIIPMISSEPNGEPSKDIEQKLEKYYVTPLKDIMIEPPLKLTETTTVQHNIILDPIGQTIQLNKSVISKSKPRRQK